MGILIKLASCKLFQPSFQATLRTPQEATPTASAPRLRQTSGDSSWQPACTAGTTANGKSGCGATHRLATCWRLSCILSKKHARQRAAPESTGETSCYDQVALGAAQAHLAVHDPFKPPEDKPKAIISKALVKHAQTVDRPHDTEPKGRAGTPACKRVRGAVKRQELK